MKTIYCVCGRSSMTADDRMTMTNVRCSQCPPKPSLQLIVETLHIDGCTLPGDHEGPCNV